MPEGQARRVWMRVSCESGAVSSCPGWEGINLWDFLSLCWSPLQGSRDDFLKCVAWRGIPLPGCEMTVCPNLSHKSDLCSIFPVHQTQIFSGYWTVYSALVLGVFGESPACVWLPCCPYSPPTIFSLPQPRFMSPPSPVMNHTGWFVLGKPILGVCLSTGVGLAKWWCEYCALSFFWSGNHMEK